MTQKPRPRQWLSNKTLFTLHGWLGMNFGLLFFKSWWKHLFKLRVRVCGGVFFSRLHRVTGVWSLIFGLIIASTGVWYLVERFLPDEAFPEYPSVAEQRLAAVGPTPPALPLARFIETAREAFAGLEPTGIYLPTGPNDAVQVRGRTGRILVRDRAHAVFLDPFDAGPKRTVNLREPTLAYINDSADGTGEAVSLRGATHAMRAALPVPGELRGDTHLRLVAKTWNDELHQADLHDTIAHQSMERSHDSPPSGNVFYAIIIGYSAIALLVAILWWFLDTRPRPRVSRRGRTN